MATTRTRTVKSSGGDYTSLSAWEAGENADLVTLDEIRVAECYAMSDTAQVTIDGWTTSATQYIKVTTPAAERHTGKWDSTKYRLERSDVLNAGVLYIVEDNVRIEGVQVYNTSTAGFANACVIQSSGNVYMSHSIFRATNSGANGRNYAVNVRCNNGYIWNCVAWGARSNDGLSVGFRDNLAAGAAYVYNCTAYDCSVGFHEGDNGFDFVVKNCLAASCTVAFQAGWNWPSACNYNATDNASTTTPGGSSNPPGANSRASQTFTFVDAANGDFHLASTDAGAKDFGTDLSADANLAFSDDIDGQTRSGSWDIGADEYVAAAAGAFPFAACHPMAHLLVR